MKFYKNKSGMVVIGNSEVTQQSPMIITWEDNDTRVIITPAGSQVPLYAGLITGLTNEAGVAYTNKADLSVGIVNFFVNKNGAVGGTLPAVLSDTVDLVNPGWFEVLTAAGDVKFTDLYGNTQILPFELNALSKFQASRIWQTGTTATGIQIYFQ